jgi:hypothetical protein
MENLNHQKVCSSTLKQQQGFALVSLVCLMPLILAGIIFLYIGTTQIEIKSVVAQTCRVELLKVQEQSIPYLKALMALNAVIDIVKFGKFLARLARILVLIPPVAAIARTVLAVTTVAEEIIPAIQKGILAALWTTMETGLFRAQKGLKNILMGYQNKSVKLLDLNLQMVFGNFVRGLSVEPEHPKKQLTKYRLKTDFEEKQKLFLHWRYELQTNSQLYEFAQWKQKFSGHCAATLKKEEPWSPTLYADKFYWNFL